MNKTDKIVKFNIFSLISNPSFSPLKTFLPRVVVGPLKRSNEPTLHKKKQHNIKNVVVVVPYWVLMSQFTAVPSSYYFLSSHSFALSFNTALLS